MNYPLYAPVISELAYISKSRGQRSVTRIARRGNMSGSDCSLEGDGALNRSKGKPAAEKASITHFASAEVWSPERVVKRMPVAGLETPMAAGDLNRHPL